MIVNENSSAFMPALDVPRDISLIADAAGMVRFMSPDAALFYAGEASNGINGRSMFDLIVPDDQSEAREWWADLVDTRAPSGEIRLGALGAGGQPEPVQIVAWRLPDEQGYLLKHHLDDFTRERLATLYTILLATSVTLELDELLDIVLQRSLHLIPADSVTAFLVDRDGRLDPDAYQWAGTGAAFTRGSRSRRRFRDDSHREGDRSRAADYRLRNRSDLGKA